MEDAELREKIFMADYLRKQAEVIQQQAELVAKNIIELETTKVALESIREVSVDTETLIPLGSGVYAYGTLTDQSKVLVNLGMDVLANKSRSEAVVIIEGQVKKLEELQDNFTQEMNKINQTMQRLNQEFEALSKK